MGDAGNEITHFLALSVDLRDEISWYALGTYLEISE